jgi:hypothetical protein
VNEKDRLEVQALIERRSIPEPNTGCWFWEATCDQDGYGRTKWKGYSRPAHRLSFEAFYGIDPIGASVLHSCDIASCVNPAHLSLGTTGKNAREAAAKGRMGRWNRTWRVAANPRSTHTRVAVGGAKVTYDLLSRFIAYNPETGEFRWLERPDDIGWTRKNAGNIAGWISPHGKRDRAVNYIRIGVAGAQFYAHRLAWLWMTGGWPGKNEIDHINGNTLDNRWDNLRAATHQQNGHNVGLRRNNRSGVKGVSWDAARGKWYASITMNGRIKSLGRHDNFDDAAAARRKAEEEYHGAFAHTVGAA